MKNYSHGNSIIAVEDGAVRREKFDAKYGRGSYEKLLQAFAKPCLSYKEIGHEFEKTKECVRQWHDKIFPDKAGTGHERMRLCATSNYRKELFGNELFRAFYKTARRYVSSGDIEFIQKKRSGLKTRSARINCKNILLRKASKYKPGEFYSDGAAYRLYTRRNNNNTDFVFYLLDNNSFLLVPSDELPEIRTIFIDSEVSKYHRFKNNFDASLKSRDKRRKRE